MTDKEIVRALRACAWQTGEDVMHWWMEDGVLPGQMVLEGLEEDTL